MSTNIAVIKRVFQWLCEQRRWVCYRKVWDEGRQKYSKIPINPHTCGNAKSNDPNTWGTLEQALGCMNTCSNIAGVMLALSPNDDLVGIDIDGCGSEQKWSLLAREIMQAANSYTEISPSGTGLRILLRGELPPGRRKNSQNGVEMYDSGRFLTITGNHVPGTPEETCERGEAIKIIHRVYLGTPKDTPVQQSNIVKQPRSTQFDDDDVLDLAINSANGEKFVSLYEGCWDDYYCSQSEADLALCCMLAFWTGWCPAQMDRMFRSSELYRAKWDRPHYGDGRTYGQGVVQKAIEVTDQCYLQDAEWEGDGGE